MIIGLMGKKRSGKDTTGKMILDIMGYGKISSFAFSLKDILTKACGEDFFTEKNREEIRPFIINLTKLEKLTGLQGLGLEDFAPIIQKDKRNHMYMMDKEWYVFIITSMRAILQHVGTDLCRNRLGADYWVNRLDLTHNNNVVVVSDVRFPSEVEKIKQCGGTLLEIVNPRVVTTDTHASEVVPEGADLVIHNTACLKHLRKEVIMALGRILEND